MLMALKEERSFGKKIIITCNEAIGFKIQSSRFKVRDLILPIILNLES